MAETPTRWLVHSEWLPASHETLPARLTQPYPDQFAAERAALHLACCAGARYVSVEGPDAIVTLDWDCYTNRACRYDRYLGVCGDEKEPDGRVCTGQLYARLADVQVRCPECGAWTGVLAPGRVRHSYY